MSVDKCDFKGRLDRLEDREQEFYDLSTKLEDREQEFCDLSTKLEDREQEFCGFRGRVGVVGADRKKAAGSMN